MIELAIHPHNAIRRIGLVLFVPLFTLVTIAILLALLGIFVLWLAIVGVLISAIVATDLVRRAVARHARPTVRLQHRPAG
jgi:membrane protein implicated in regulation of membrane protease activity